MILLHYYCLVTYFIEAKQRTKYIYKHIDRLTYYHIHVYTHTYPPRPTNLLKEKKIF